MISKDYLQNNWKSDLRKLLTSTPNPERPIRLRLLIFGALFGVLVPIGALWGFRFAYKKLGFREKQVDPTLNGKPAIVYVAMIAGAVFLMLLPFALFILYYFIMQIVQSDYRLAAGVTLIFKLVLINFVLSLITLWIFNNWQNGVFNYLNELRRHGTARFAYPEELAPYHEERQPKGFYIGGGLRYSKQGHLLTVAGTRAGKSVHLLLPNLIPKTGSFSGSWVVIDPKGEIAAITSKAQKAAGKKVVMLNPWDLLKLGGGSYNPLDLLKEDKLNLTDDIEMIAESIVPTSAGGDKDHFDNRARSIISALLLHLVTAYQKQDRELATIWEWLRYGVEEWKNLVKEMADNKTELGGEIVQAAASEITSMMEQGAREFSSIMSTARKHTDFLKSPALRESMKAESSFNSAELTDGNTIVYIIIPVDRLKSQPRWLRLVVSSLMRSVVRNPNKDVCFLLDEAYALGYLSEIETALGAYAGYNLHLWTVWQNLVQMRDLYGNNFENFISSCSVRHFFNISDNFSADYISKAFGTFSVPTYGPTGITGASARNLVNPDELRKESGEKIYTVIDQLSPAEFYKWPYFNMQVTEGIDYEKNPYFKG